MLPQAGSCHAVAAYARPTAGTPHSRSMQDRTASQQDCRNLLDDGAAAVSTSRCPSSLVGSAHRPGGFSRCGKPLSQWAGPPTAEDHPRAKTKSAGGRKPAGAQRRVKKLETVGRAEATGRWCCVRAPRRGPGRPSGGRRRPTEGAARAGREGIDASLPREPSWDFGAEDEDTASGLPVRPTQEVL